MQRPCAAQKAGRRPSWACLRRGTRDERLAPCSQIWPKTAEAPQSHLNPVRDKHYVPAWLVPDIRTNGPTPMSSVSLRVALSEPSPCFPVRAEGALQTAETTHEESCARRLCEVPAYVIRCRDAMGKRATALFGFVLGHWLLSPGPAANWRRGAGAKVRGLGLDQQERWLRTRFIPAPIMRQ